MSNIALRALPQSVNASGNEPVNPQTGKFRAQGVFTLKMKKKKENKHKTIIEKGTELICDRGSLQIIHSGKSKSQVDDFILLGQFSKIEMRNPKTIVLFIMDYIENKETELYHVFCENITSISATVPLSMYLSHIYDCIFIQHKLFGAHLSCHTFRSPPQLSGHPTCCLRSCGGKIDPRQLESFLYCEICLSTVHINCCAKFLASNKYTFLEHGSDDCLSILKRSSSSIALDEYPKMIKAFTNHHLNSSEITTLPQINMMIFLTSKVDFSTSPSNEKFAEEKRWPIRNSVFENIDNTFVKFVQGRPLLEMCHFAENINNENLSTMTTIDYLLSLVLTELHTVEQYQTARSCLLLLSSLLLQSGNTQSRSSLMFEQSKIDPHKTLLTQLAQNQMKIPITSPGFIQNDGYFIPLIIMKIVQQQSNEKSIRSLSYSNYHALCTTLGLTAINILNSYESDLSAVYPGDKIKLRTVYFNLNKIVYYSTNFLKSHNYNYSLQFHSPSKQLGVASLNNPSFLNNFEIFEYWAKIDPASSFDSNTTSILDNSVTILRNLSRNNNKINLCMLKSSPNCFLVQKQCASFKAELFMAKICSSNIHCCSFLGLNPDSGSRFILLILRYYEKGSLYEVIMKMQREAVFRRLINYIDSCIAKFNIERVKKLLKLKLFLLLDKILPILTNSNLVYTESDDQETAMTNIINEFTTVHNLDIDIINNMVKIIMALKQEYSSFFKDEKIERNCSYFHNTLPQVVPHYSLKTQLYFDNSLIINIALDIAHALSFLHSKKIPHQNVGTGCILFDNHYKAFVSGFNTTLNFNKGKSLTSNSQRISLQDSSVDTSQGSGSSRSVSHLERDIAKFGLVIWQMWSLEISHLDPDESDFRPEINEFNKFTHTKIEDELKSLIERMWHRDASKRPSIEKVSNIMTLCLLTKSLEFISVIETLFSLQDPMRYYRFAPTSGRKSDLSSSSKSSQLESLLRRRDENEVKLDPISYSQKHMLITEHNPHIWDQIFAILDVINVNCKRNLHLHADKALGSAALRVALKKRNRKFTATKSNVKERGGIEYMLGSNRTTPIDSKDKLIVESGSLSVNINTHSPTTSKLKKSPTNSSTSTTTPSSTHSTSGSTFVTTAPSKTNKKAKNNNNSGSNTPTRPTAILPQSSPTIQRKVGQFSRENSDGVGSSERVEILITHSYSIMKLFSQLRADSDSFVSWNIALSFSSSDDDQLKNLRILKASFDFGNLLSIPTTELTFAPFSVNSIVTCIVPIQVKVTVVIDDQSPKEFSFITTFDLRDKASLEPSPTNERNGIQRRIHSIPLVPGNVKSTRGTGITSGTSSGQEKQLL